MKQALGVFGATRFFCRFPSRRMGSGARTFLESLAELFRALFHSLLVFLEERFGFGALVA